MYILVSHCRAEVSLWSFHSSQTMKLFAKVFCSPRLLLLGIFSSYLGLGKGGKGGVPNSYWQNHPGVTNRTSAQYCGNPNSSAAPSSETAGWSPLVLNYQVCGWLFPTLETILITSPVAILTRSALWNCVAYSSLVTSLICGITSCAHFGGSTPTLLCEKQFLISF